MFHERFGSVLPKTTASSASRGAAAFIFSFLIIKPCSVRSSIINLHHLPQKGEEPFIQLPQVSREVDSRDPIIKPGLAVMNSLPLSEMVSPFLSHPNSVLLVDSQVARASSKRGAAERSPNKQCGIRPYFYLPCCSN